MDYKIAVKFQNMFDLLAKLLSVAMTVYNTWENMVIMEIKS